MPSPPPSTLTKYSEVHFDNNQKHYDHNIALTICFEKKKSYKNISRLTKPWWLSSLVRLISRHLHHLKVGGLKPDTSFYISNCSLIGFISLSFWSRIISAEVVSSAHAQPRAYVDGVMLKIECMLVQHNLQRLLCVSMCQV